MPPRRTRDSVEMGTIFAIPWTEWHVDCATCGTMTLMVSLGMAESFRDAEKRIKEHGPEDAKDWEKKGGKWYCPKCKGAQ